MKYRTTLNDSVIDEYLSMLAVQRNLSINTQKATLNALVFFCEKCLQRPFARLKPEAVAFELRNDAALAAPQSLLISRCLLEYE